MNPFQPEMSTALRSSLPSLDLHPVISGRPRRHRQVPRARGESSARRCTFLKQVYHATGRFACNLDLALFEWHSQSIVNSLDSEDIFEKIQAAWEGGLELHLAVLGEIAPFVYTKASQICLKFQPTLDPAHDAKDIAAISLAKLLPPNRKGGLYTLKSPRGLMLFICRTIRNECVDLVKKRVAERKRTQSIDQPLPGQDDRRLQDTLPDPNSPTPGRVETATDDEATEIPADQLLAILSSCLSTLSDSEREAIRLRFQLAGAPKAETYGKQQLVPGKKVAELMQEDPQNVNNWIYRGLKNLLSCLVSKGYNIQSFEGELRLMRENSHES